MGRYRWKRSAQKIQAAQLVMGASLSPTVDVWVSRGPDGELIPIRVVDMTDGHLTRWIQYFRKKYLQDGVAAETVTELDLFIQRQLVTGPAIYTEAKRRALLPDLPVLVQEPTLTNGSKVPKMVSTTTKTTWAIDVLDHGARRIDLEE